MPSKRFTHWLDGCTYIAVDFVTFEGEVLAFVVRLVHIVADDHRDIARYDTAHGQPHCDVLTRRGRIRDKRWLMDDFNQALAYAIEDFKANYRTYIEAQG